MPVIAGGPDKRPIRARRGLAEAWKAKAKWLRKEIRHWENSYDRLDETLARVMKMAESKTERLDLLVTVAKQHRPGSIHTRDLGNPCKECGAPGPSTKIYCERCALKILAEGLLEVVGFPSIFDTAQEGDDVMALIEDRIVAGLPIHPTDAGWLVQWERDAEQQEAKTLDRLEGVEERARKEVDAIRLAFREEAEHYRAVAEQKERAASELLTVAHGFLALMEAGAVAVSVDDLPDMAEGVRRAIAAAEGDETIYAD